MVGSHRKVRIRHGRSSTTSLAIALCNLEKGTSACDLLERRATDDCRSLCIAASRCAFGSADLSPPNLSDCNCPWTNLLEVLVLCVFFDFGQIRRVARHLKILLAPIAPAIQHINRV